MPTNCEQRDKLFAESIDILAIAGLDGLIKSVNPAAERILGFAPVELVGKPFLDFISEDDRSGGLDALAQLAAGKSTERFECRMRRRDGRERWVAWSVAPDTVEPLLYAVGRDISEQRAAEAALRESEERYRLLVERSPDCIVVYARGAIVFANAAAARLVGADNPSQLLGLTADHFVPRDYQTSVAQGLRQNMASASGPVIFERTFVRLDGSFIDVELAVMSLTFHGEPAVQVIARDISGHKRVEAALQAALGEASRRREQTRVLFEAARAVLNRGELAKDAEGVFRSCKDLIGASAGYVALLDENGQMGNGLIVDLGDYESVADTRFPMPLRGIREMACRTGKAVFDNDFAGSDFSRLRTAGHLPFDNVLCAPLLIGSRVAGLMGLYNKPGGFSEDDAHLASAFAEILAVALANGQMVETLASSEERFRTVVQTATDAIVLTDASGNILFWNNGAERIFGYSAEAAVGRSIYTIVPARSQARTREGITLEMQAGTQANGYGPVEVRGLRKDGTEFPAELTYSAWRTREGLFFAAFVHDTTGRKRAESALRESEARYRDVFDNAPIGIYRTSPEGRVLVANPALVRLFGFDSFEELAKLDLETEGFMAPGDRARFRRILEQDGEVTGLESALRRRDGSAVFVRENARLVRDGNQLYYEGTVEDITDRKRAEETLEHSLAKLRRTLEGTIDAMALLVETRDPYTAGHQQRVSRLACAIARSMAVSAEQLTAVRFAATIHDIGKVGVPAGILSRPGRITATERHIVQSHPRIGHNILNSIEFPWPIAEIVLQHHERLDGSGYPSGLTAGQILLEALIIGVADVVEAMASHRPYRPALGIEPALEEISRGRDVLYDRGVVDACFRVFRDQHFGWE